MPRSGVLHTLHRASSPVDGDPSCRVICPLPLGIPVVQYVVSGSSMWMKQRGLKAKTDYTRRSRSIKWTT
jgi:hypothetical protein